MATRLRFPRGSAIGYGGITGDSHWDTLAGMITRRIDTVGIDHGSQWSIALAETGTARWSKPWVQFQTHGLKAQTIAGTLKGQIQAMESDAAMDAAIQVHVRVVDPIANTTRGVLWAPDKTYTSISSTPGDHNYEIATTKTNRKAPSGWSGAGVSLSSVDAQDGDILIIEVGLRYTNTVSTSYTGTLYFGGDPAADLPEDETQTTTGTAWMEFSQDLLFMGTEIIEPLELSLAKLPVIQGLGSPPPTVGQIWPRGNRGV